MTNLTFSIQKDNNNSSLITHKVEDSFVEQRREDGYINATALTKAYKLATGKRRDVSEWLANKRTKETLEHLSSKTGIPVFELYQAFQGSPENGGGTWIHPKLAVRFGIWLSDEFGYMVEEWVQQWLTKRTNSEELAARVKQLEQQLVTALDAIAALQSQIQPLLPPDSNTPPPGWNPEVWQQLPPQDKRHFRLLHRRRQFRPSNQSGDEPLALPASTQMKQRQRAQVSKLIGEVTEAEKARVEALKDVLFTRLDEEV